MQMNPGIILSGQGLDAMGAIRSGNEAAAQTNALAQQNKLRQLYNEQGAGILAGDENALNALAGIDPNAALGIQDARLGMDSTRLGMEATRQNMAFGAEEMAMKREQAKLAAAEHVATMSAAERAAELEQIEKGVAAGMAAKSPQEWDSLMTSMGMDDMVGRFAERDMIAAGYMGIADALKTYGGNVDPAAVTAGAPDGTMWADPNDRTKGVVPLPGVESRGPEWVDLTPDELAQYGYVSGQRNSKTGKVEGKTPPKGTRITSDGKGGVIIEEGSAIGDKKDSPSDPGKMIDSIDGILNDPALDNATGLWSWTQSIPGTESYRFGTRAKQLQGQAFLQAFESLKGAGQITEIEGTKATEAIGRLDTAQSASDYRQALKELREVLESAQKRAPGGAAGDTSTPELPPGFVVD